METSIDFSQSMDEMLIIEERKLSEIAKLMRRTSYLSARRNLAARNYKSRRSDELTI